MSDTQTARFALPMLQPGQAQKELYHNEALVLLDLAVQPVVVEIGLNVPPTAPSPGQSWIVGASPTGAWSGTATHLAGWTGGGWRFVAPSDGMTVWSLADALQARFAAGVWVVGESRAARLMVGNQQVIGPQREAIAAPIGGPTADTEARAAITSILAALRAHGLIAG
ncbi:DUF2793 domain-containing protein [Sphingomonas sp. 28-62-11]|uniref:DUF2793 domain-containing protein n=1 Tax=Sphingomonas sp. 28-62-11 TaxID=1970432 RepID=UPI000BD9E71D|nr:MAG: hypothetical protein B7Y49_14330 [Sphingomonas sp. 28-62-11]